MAGRQVDGLSYPVSGLRDYAEGVDAGIQRSYEVRSDRGTLRERLSRLPRSWHGLRVAVADDVNVKPEPRLDDGGAGGGASGHWKWPWGGCGEL